jgi:Na+/proline symporter
VCGTIVAVELISRFLGAKTARIAARGTMLGGVVYLIIGLIPLYLGLVGPQLAPDLKDSEQIIPTIAETYLPTAAFIIFIGALISAILSVVHATLHAPAAQVAQNLLGSVAAGAAPKQRLWFVRLTVAALSVIAFLLALTSDTIKELVETASAFGSAGVFVVTMFGLFTNFGQERAAIATIVVGVGVWAVARYAGALETPYLIGLAASALTYVAVSVWADGRLSTG